MQALPVTGGTLLVAPVSGFFRPSTLNLALRAFYAARAADRSDHPAGGATQVCPVPLDNCILPQGGLNVNTFFQIFRIFFRGVPAATFSYARLPDRLSFAL